MYNTVETNFILYVFLGFTLIPYFIYLASSLDDHSVLQSEDYNRSQVAGVGFFNIINTRHAGFSLINDLSDLNSGVLVCTYCIANIVPLETDH